MWKIASGVVCIWLLSGSFLHAQEKLQVYGSSPELYLQHEVLAGENWYSIGRRYNLSPNEIAAYNRVSLEKMLSKAQTLRIPLTERNFSQQGAKLPDEVFVPVYHQAGKREWMYRISKQYHKVPIASLESWNRISNDQLRSGMWLIVGFLKVKKEFSPLAGSGLENVNTIPATVSTPATETSVSKNWPESKHPEPARPAVSEVKKDAESAREIFPATTNPTATPAANVNHKGGVFRRLYEDKGAMLSGNAGVFRSTSGWNDGKYYALMNEVPAGTIVKVTFTSTNKNIYAKVLGQLPEMRENAGLSLRISDAAAAELGVGNPKFYVDVHY